MFRLRTFVLIAFFTYFDCDHVQINLFVSQKHAADFLIKRKFKKVYIWILKCQSENFFLRLKFCGLVSSLFLIFSLIFQKNGGG